MKITKNILLNIQNIVFVTYKFYKNDYHRTGLYYHRIYGNHFYLITIRKWTTENTIVITLTNENMENINLTESDLKSMQDALDFFEGGDFTAKANLHVIESGGDVDFLIKNYSRMIAMPNIANNTNQLIVDYRTLMNKLINHYKTYS